MSDYTASSTKRALAQRITVHSGTSVPSLEIRAEPLDAGLLEDLRDHLLAGETHYTCLLYTSPSPRDLSTSRMPSSA